MAGLIIHEWIANSGGSERVVKSYTNIYPDADIFCLWNDGNDDLKSSSTRESWISRTPLRRSKVLSIPFMPSVWSGLKPDNYEWALISSHLFSHHALRKFPALARYIYVHTPARYIWEPSLDHRGHSLGAKSVSPVLRWYDKKNAQSNANIAANSHFVRERIMRCWGRDARVIYPPVNVDEIQNRSYWADALIGAERELLESLPETFILGASRFVAYKGLERVIQGGESVQVPVVIAGSGPGERELRRYAETASVPVTFIIRPSTPLLYALYQRALVFVFPPIEDFGIMPVEAMATGTPVIVNTIGGTTESVVSGESGMHVHRWSGVEFVAAVDAASRLRGAGPAMQARLFSEAVFRERTKEWMRSE